MTDGKIHGYYPVLELKFVRYHGGVAIRFMLGGNISLGSAWVDVLDWEIRSGPLYSLEECMQMYRHWRPF